MTKAAQPKSKSPLAYAHYLQTGTIYGYYEGAKIQGSGRPPENPLSPEAFDRAAAAIPKPGKSPAPKKPETLFLLTPNDLSWSEWLHAMPQAQRAEAEETGVISTTARWPANGHFLAVEPTDARERYMKGSGGGQTPTDEERVRVQRMVNEANKKFDADRARKTPRAAPALTPSILSGETYKLDRQEVSRVKQLIKRLPGD